MRLFALILFSLSMFSFVNSQDHARHSGPNPPKAEWYPRGHQFIFHAVLEGCFRDGVSTDDLTHIIPTPDDDSEFPDYFTNFVYACPLCSPTYEAFRLYNLRLPFANEKPGTHDTFGIGLPKEVKMQLAGEPIERRKAIRTLVEKWTNERMTQLRLTKDEKADLHSELTRMKKRGEEMLKNFQTKKDGAFSDYYKDWKACAVCS
ncbi:MAG: hypothetical protein AAF226_00625, partial [Verrucomicrobiota bacterium]